MVLVNLDDIEPIPMPLGADEITPPPPPPSGQQQPSQPPPTVAEQALPTKTKAAKAKAKTRSSGSKIRFGDDGGGAAAAKQRPEEPAANYADADEERGVGGSGIREEGGTAKHRQCHAHVRRQASAEPQDEISRFKNKLKTMVDKNKLGGDGGSETDSYVAEQRQQRQQQEMRHRRYRVSRSFDEKVRKSQREPAARQYRLEAVKGSADTKYDDTAGMNSASSSSGGCGLKWLCCGYDANLTVVRYLHWAYRRSFTEVFLSLCVVWLTLITIFAGAIYSISLRYPTCMAGLDFNPDYFLDSWELSWTTLSTVGYGLVSQGTSAHEPNIVNCTGMTILLVTEAFIGILFSATCGAIVLSKVARIQSYAQVMFSDPMVLRYGSGVQSEGQKNTPCPILEFRVINRMSEVIGGEIVDASVNLVASIDTKQSSLSARIAAEAERKKHKKIKKHGQSHPGPNIVSVKQAVASHDITSPVLLKIKSLSNGQAVDAASSSIDWQSRNMVFVRLDAETSDHPFFKRVWTVRHRLDENSPLLMKEVRELIRRNDGYWPEELNDHKDVRASVLFDQILVTISGTSNADANSVYAQHIYNYSCVNVGYRFCNLLYQDPRTGAVCVDPEMLNDVMEQEGGGGEAFQNLGIGAYTGGDMDIL